MKKLLIQIGVLMALLISLSISIKSCTDNKRAKEQAERNAIALTSDVETYKTKAGETANVVKGLELSINSLEEINADLYKELEDTKVKLKNAQSVVKIETVVEYRNADTVYLERNGDIFALNYSDDYIAIGMEIDAKNEVLLPDKLNIEIPNETTIVTETLTKCHWIFWKKAIGVQVTVVNSNPYIEVDDIFYVDLLK